MRQRPIKNRLSLLISLLIIVLAIMWALGRCSRSKGNSIADIPARPGGDTLVVSIEFAPTSYAFSGDSIVGFDYEVLRSIASEHNLELVFQPFAPIDYALNGLRNGDFDIVVASEPASQDLKEEFLLTDDIFVDRQVLVSLRDTSDTNSDVPPQLRLLGDTVWISDSPAFRSRLRNLASELGDTIYIKSSPGYNAEHLVTLTALGEIRQAVVNESVARRLAVEYPQLDISTPISLSQFQPWIIAPKHKVLRDSLNVWLNQYKSTEAYKRLVEKYL